MLLFTDDKDWSVEVTKMPPNLPPANMPDDEVEARKKAHDELQRKLLELQKEETK